MDQSDKTLERRTMSFYFLLLWTFILIGRPQDIFPSLVPLRPALVCTIITLLATLLGTKRISLHALFKSGESKKYALFYLLMILGIPFAFHRHMAFNYIFLVYLSNILFFYIFISQVDSFKKLNSIIFTICFSIFFYGVFSLAKGSFFYRYLPSGIGDSLSWTHDQRFHFGTMYDSNDLAYILMSLFPLSLFYLVHNEGFFKKIFAITTALVSVGVILLTGSRGGFLGFIIAFILIFFTKLSGLKWSFKVLLLIILLVFLISYSDKINVGRYMSLLAIGSDYNVQGEFGRLGIWKRGIQFIISYPITGVGVDCFWMVIGYVRDAEALLPAWEVAHNSFLQIAAEVGLIGFVFFTSLILGCIKNFSRCRRIEVLSAEAHEIKTVAGLLQVGFIGHLITAFFLTQGYSILFTLYFAFSATLRKIQMDLFNGSARNILPQKEVK